MLREVVNGLDGGIPRSPSKRKKPGPRLGAELSQTA